MRTRSVQGAVLCALLGVLSAASAVPLEEAAEDALLLQIGRPAAVVADRKANKGEAHRRVRQLWQMIHGGDRSEDEDQADKMMPDPLQLKISHQPATSLKKGCCFSFKHGVAMKPCCLKASTVNASECNSGAHEKVFTAFTLGEVCPSTVEEGSFWSLDAPEREDWESQMHSKQWQNYESNRHSRFGNQGCCYSFMARGQMKEPCCLKTEVVTHHAHCEVGTHESRSTGFEPGTTCPATALEASTWLRVHWEKVQWQQLLPKYALAVVLSLWVLLAFTAFTVNCCVLPKDGDRIGRWDEGFDTPRGGNEHEAQ